MEIYSGLDLHSTNTYIGILDIDFKRVIESLKPSEKGEISKRNVNFCKSLEIAGI